MREKAFPLYQLYHCGMDLKQLSYFVHVAECGSFTRAAALLQIAQPALSRQVRQLEVELRQTLLTRNGRGVALTDAGKRLLEHSRGILHQVERAREDLDEMRGAPVGHVAIGLPPTVGRILTAPLVYAFQQRFPRATLGIVEGLSTYITEWLAAGRIDAGLIYNPSHTPQIDTTPLIAEPLYLIGPVVESPPPAPRSTAAGTTTSVKRGGRAGTRPAAPTPALKRSDPAPSSIGAPLALRDLPRFPLVMPSRPHAIRMLVENQLAGIGERINVAWEIDGIPAILDLVARGHGYAVLSLNAIRNDPARVRLTRRPIVKPLLVTALAIAVPAQRPLTPLAQKVVALIREIAPRELELAPE